MKHIILTIILISVFSTSKAQTLLEKSDAIIEHLDKSKIPFNVLYDRMSPISELTSFNVNDSIGTSSPILFHQSYFEFYKSSYDNDNLITPEQIIINANTNYPSEFDHPIGILNANFATIDSNAIENNSLTINNEQLFDNPNAESPYLTNHAIVISPILNELGITQGIHKFYLNHNFMLGNATHSYATMKLSFDNGLTYQTRDLLGLTNTEIDNLPPFEFDFKEDITEFVLLEELELENGLVVKTKSIFQINESYKKSKECDTCIVIQGCDGGDQFQITADSYAPLSDYGVTPNQAEGTAFVFYADANCASHQLTKPIIFLDGYDPDNGRDVRKIYTRYINKPFTLPSNTNVRLADHLRSLGYDIIVLNFGDGGDFIENNAMVLAKTIETLYAQHSATIQKDFVIIGPSMGALIGQFALSYMETNNIPSHTRLYISFDGPHQGANVSIGAQEMAAYALQGGVLNVICENALEEAKHNMYSNNAARQMLLHHQEMNSSSPQPHPFRSHFLAHLNAVNKYPASIRKVAIINGNKNGILNPFFNSTDQMSQLKHTSFGLGSWPFVLRHLNWKVFATSNTLNSSHSGKFFTYWPFASLMLGIPTGLTTFNSISNVNRSLDIAPGSYLGAEIVNEETNFVKLYNKLPFNVINTNGLSNVTFIPTTSAADISITSQNDGENTNLQFMKLNNCDSHTPFDAVYANSYNTNHVDVDANIASWFLTEIEKGDSGPQCMQICSDAIIGSSVICPNTTEAYDLNQLIPAQYFPYVSTIWESSPGLNVTNFFNAAFVESNSNATSGGEWLKVTIVNPCGPNVVLQRGIQTSPNPASLELNRSYWFGCQSRVRATLAGGQVLPAGSTYLFSTDGVNYFPSNYAGGQSNYFTFYNYVNTPFQVWCKVTTPCDGLLPIIYKSFPSMNNPSCSQKTIEETPSIQENLQIDAYPNPTTNTWNIIFYNFALIKKANMKLIDINGKIVWTGTKTDFNNSNIQIPADNLASGIYCLKIITESQTTALKLIKE